VEDDDGFRNASGRKIGSEVVTRFASADWHEPARITAKQAALPIPWNR
jgi:hypothetical protein